MIATERSDSSSTRLGPACAALAVLAGAVYLNALHNPFVHDDFPSVVDNTSIRPPWDLREIVLRGVTRPLINLSYALDRSVWGPDPFGFHVTNILCHMLNVVLLCLVAERFARDRQANSVGSPGGDRAIDPRIVGIACAALFAIHPLMTEAVGYISGRSEVLCATMVLLTVLSARRWMRAGGEGWRWLSLGLWVGALAAKEIAAMLPMVLLCYDWFVLGGDPAKRRRRLLTFHAPLMLMALVGGLLRLAVFIFIEHAGDLVASWQLAIVEVEVVFRYLVLFVSLRGQSIFHEVPAVTSVFETSALFAISVLTLVLAFAWRMRRAASLVTLGIVWFLLMLVPSAVLVIFDRGEPMAEHRVYVAACGLFLAAGYAIAWLLERVSQARPALRMLMRGLLAAGVVVLASFTLLRNAVWSDPVALWLEATARAPRNWSTRVMLGDALRSAGRGEEAVTSYKNALALRPQEARVYARLGLYQAELGQLDAAAETFEQLRRIDPHSEGALTGLGTVAMMAGQNEDARQYFLETIRRHPGAVAARQSLAMLEEAQENPQEALLRCEEIRRLAPRTPGNAECIVRNQSRLALPVTRP